jgi:endonuclease YncB( thermonuclease family)
MANIFDFRKRDAGPWSRKPEPDWHRKPTRPRNLAERFALALGFFVLGAGIAAAAINYQRLPELAAYLRGERAAALDDRVAAPHPDYYKPVRPLSSERYAAIDGDSLRSGNEDIRLLGIDAPELSQRCSKNGQEWACGRAAHERLKQLVMRNDVRCEAKGRDRYGRTLARCSAGGADIGDTMVREGLALNFMEGGYERHERDARIARRGIWAGEFDLPQEHRRRTQPRAQR